MFFVNRSQVIIKWLIFLKFGNFTDNYRLSSYGLLSYRLSSSISISEISFFLPVDYLLIIKSGIDKTRIGIPSTSINFEFEYALSKEAFSQEGITKISISIVERGKTCAAIA